MEIWYRTGSLGSRSSVTRLELFSGQNYTIITANIVLKFRTETMSTVISYIFQLCIEILKLHCTTE